MGRERRKHPRNKIIKLPGVLLSQTTGQPLECDPMDMSKEGIGIFVKTAIEKNNTTFFLVIGDESLVLEVVWTAENPGRSEGFRVGLKTQDPELDLNKYFEGCLEVK